MEPITDLRFHENVRLDGDRLNRLIRNLNQNDAEDVICRTMAELGLQIDKCEQAHQKQDTASLYQQVSVVSKTAGQLGMTKLQGIADHVMHAMVQSDPAATAATLARLIRIWDLSLCAVWDVKGPHA